MKDLVTTLSKYIGTKILISCGPSEVELETVGLTGKQFQEIGGSSNRITINTCRLLYSIHLLLLLCLSDFDNAFLNTRYSINNFDAASLTRTSLFRSNIGESASATKTAGINLVGYGVTDFGATDTVDNKIAAFKTKQFNKQQHHFDNKSNDNNFYSNIRAIGVKQLMRITCDYMIAFSLAKFISSLEYIACIFCLQAKQYFNWCFDSSFKVIKYTTPCLLFLQSRRGLELGRRRNAAIRAVIKNTCLYYLRLNFLKTYRQYFNHEQTKKTVAIATTSCKVLLIMWPLCEVLRPLSVTSAQQHRKLHVAHRVLQHQLQQNILNRCSFYLGNVYQKVPKLQKQQTPLDATEINQKPKQHLYAYTFFLYEQSSGTHAIFKVHVYILRVDSSSSCILLTVASKLTTAMISLPVISAKIYTLNKQKYRHRWRRRKGQQLGIDSNVMYAQLLLPRVKRILWHKTHMRQQQQLQKQENESQQQEQQKQHQESVNDSATYYTERLELVNKKYCHCVCYIYCLCCEIDYRHRNFNGASLQNNIKNIDDNSCGGTSNYSKYSDSNSNNKEETKNINSGGSTNNKVHYQEDFGNACYCCCCYCCCYHNYSYCCCYYCYIHCPFCFCSSLCTCWQHHQQHQLQEQQLNNNNTSNNSDVNSNKNTTQSSDERQKQNKNQQQQHQQQQYNQKTYNQRHHERQQHQNIFFQQPYFYHRRRRRHFCVSYTSLHSCSCCFFKWICWRHHNFRKQFRCFSSNRVNQDYQQKLFYRILLEKYCRIASKRFSTTTKKSLFNRQQQKQIRVSSHNECKSIKNCYNKKRHKRRCSQNLTSLRLRHKRRQFLKHQQQCSGKYVFLQATTVRALKKKKSNSETYSTNTTLKSPMTATGTDFGSTARMFKRLFRRHWVWLVIGLAWLEGSKLAECNTIMKIGPATNDYVAAFRNNNCSSDRSSSSSTCTQAVIPPTLPQSLADSIKIQLNQRSSRRSSQRAYASSNTASIQNREEENKKQNDTIRLESIKLQILSKLGLKSKPNVTYRLPKQFIWDTIYRADGISTVSDFDFNDVHQTHQVKLFRYATVAHHKSNSRVVRAHTATTYGRSRDYKKRIVDTDVKDNYDEVAGNVFEIKSDDEQDGEEKGLFFQNSRKNRNKLQYKPHSSSQKYTQHNKFYYEMDKTSKNGRKSSENHLSHQSSKQRKAKSSRRKHDAVPQAAVNDKYEPDDYYGNTQEIITFAEKGEMYKKHRLIEFSSPKHGVSDQQLHIRHAEVHIRIEKVQYMSAATENSRKMINTKLKLWVFQLITGDYSEGSFDRMARYCTSLNVEINALGWQKLDITKTVQYWYDQSAPNDKLRLLIDCTGCGQNFVLYLFDIVNRTTTKNSAMSSQHDQQQHYQRGHPLRRNQLRSSSDVFNDTRSVTKNIAGSTEVVHKFPNQRHEPKYWGSNDESHQKHAFNSFNTQHSGNWKGKKNEHGQRKGKSHDSLQQQQQIPNAENSASNEFDSIEDYLNPYRPILVMHTEPKRARRVRRRVIDCSGALHGQCCKESFYVSFKALGWDDWIIAPRGYFANYCRGDCSGPYRTPDTFQTFHAHFIEEYRKLGLLNGMQPCCAPIKFSSMSIIYYGDDGIIKRDLPKMVVDECGCP